MDITITPRKLQGRVTAIPSKSQAHRLLICAAFADASTTLYCPQINRDIQATVDCLNALGARILRTGNGYTVAPLAVPPKKAELDCCESGSTLRFLLPIVGALGVDATFHLSGRLPQRPLSPLWEEMERMGCRLTRPTENTIRCTGQLKSGIYSISGGVSSQFVTGLLYALSLLPQESRLELTGKVESKPYIHMTIAALNAFGAAVPEENQCYTIVPQTFHSPGELMVEGDWSNAAFWLATRSLGCEVEITNLNADSPQGDRAVVQCLQALEKNTVIDAAHTPDLVPVLAVVAAAKKGASFINAARLRLKETDRLATTAAMIRDLGAQADIRGDCLFVSGTGLKGGTVDATGDHRIAMAAAVASTVCTETVTIIGAESVEKSYPAFWRDFQMLGGKL